MREPGRTAGPSPPPDFLSKTVASVDFHAALYGEPHTLPLVEPCSRKSGYARDDKGEGGYFCQEPSDRMDEWDPRPDYWVLLGHGFRAGDQVVNLGAVLFYGAHTDAGDGKQGRVAFGAGGGDVA